MQEASGIFNRTLRSKGSVVVSQRCNAPNFSGKQNLVAVQRITTPFVKYASTSPNSGAQGDLHLRFIASQLSVVPGKIVLI
jgi:hypothetical protein